MKVTQENERTYKVVLSDVELSDLKSEAKNRDFTPLEIMKAVFFSVFVQIVSCFWRRTMIDKHKYDYLKDEGKINDG